MVLSDNDRDVARLIRENLPAHNTLIRLSVRIARPSLAVYKVLTLSTTEQIMACRPILGPTAAPSEYSLVVVPSAS
jgi:hypothetical protein